ncbi:MAG: DUF6240 domain-containing protein [Lachnospiraceae bacterium]|nr:DUF6240 domain-containing protein [Lachnospiraceae bacterium]
MNELNMTATSLAGLSLTGDKKEESLSSVADLYMNTMASALNQVSREGNGTKVNKTIASTIEGLSSVEETMKQNAALAKENLKSLMNKMTGPDCESLRMEDVDVNEISDEEAMNVVERLKIMLAAYNDNFKAFAKGVGVDEAMLQGMDRAMEGGIPSASLEAAKSALRASDLPETVENQNQLLELDQKAGEVAKNLPLSEGAKDFLIRGELPASIENLHKAIYGGAGNVVPAGANEKEASWEAVKPQVISMVERMSTKMTEGQEKTEAQVQTESQAQTEAQITVEKGQSQGMAADRGQFQDMEAAKWLFLRDLPVTEENIQYKETLDQLSLSYEGEDALELLKAGAQALTEGQRATSIGVIPEETSYQIAARAMGVVCAADFSEVSKVVQEGLPLTVEHLEEALRYRNSASLEETVNSLQSRMNSVGSMLQEGSDQFLDDIILQGGMTQDEAYTQEEFASYRVLCEARILMTASATVNLVRGGVDVIHEDLSHMVSLLHEEEVKMIEASLRAGTDAADSFASGKGRTSAVELSAEATAHTIQDVVDLMHELSYGPSAVLGELVGETDESAYTLPVLRDHSRVLQNKLVAAGVAYETMSTTIRSDLGDSVKAALKESSDTILSDLSLATTEENRRAVRILVNNSLEVTKDRVEEVRELDSVMNSLIDQMTPEVVMDLIHERINPMTTDIRTLNQYFNQRYDGHMEGEKYSEFLYHLDRTQGISESEREEYIGIYRMLHTLQKNDGNALGLALEQSVDQSLTLEDLMSAYQSTKAAGVDVKVDPSMGLSEVSGNVLYYENLFGKMTGDLAPEYLDKVLAREDAKEMTVEEIAMALSDASTDPATHQEHMATEALYQEELLGNLRRACDTEEYVIRTLSDRGLTVTANGVNHTKALLTEQSFFQDLQEFVSEENPKLQELIEHLPETFGTKEEAAVYEELETSMEELFQEKALGGRGSIDDYLALHQMRDLVERTGIIRDLASGGQYILPYDTGHGLGTMNLQIVSRGKNEGALEMHFESGALGEVAARFQVSQTKLSGYLTLHGEGKETEVLSEKLATLSEKLQELGVETTDIRYSVSADLPYTNLVGEEETPSSFIYQVAKIILQNL